ncbi:MAG: ThuA domain-containing protein [Eubacteriales bacterium]|nr:ThuA domain-containing protein [Eubacteriales bacterium]
MAINITIWNENIHDKNDKVRAIYPEGLHGAIKAALDEDEQKRFITRAALLDQPDQGLPDEVLENTDVLFWWGHVAHDKVDDALVERVWKRVISDGMGMVLLHSAHFSKISKRLMGTVCRSKWRESGDKERIWVIEPGHPIAEGLPEYFELPEEETYGERFDVPAPEELVFISWFSGGEVLRSGNCYHRGNGKVFYCQPGHETFPTYLDTNIKKVLRNAAAWAAPVKGPVPTFGKYGILEK